MCLRTHPSPVTGEKRCLRPSPAGTPSARQTTPPTVASQQSPGVGATRPVMPLHDEFPCATAPRQCRRCARLVLPGDVICPALLLWPGGTPPRAVSPCCVCGHMPSRCSLRTVVLAPSRRRASSRHLAPPLEFWINGESEREEWREKDEWRVDGELSQSDKVCSGTHHVRWQCKCEIHRAAWQETCCQLIYISWNVC
jgi:hypothetical protein